MEGKAAQRGGLIALLAAGAGLGLLAVGAFAVVELGAGRRVRAAREAMGAALGGVGAKVLDDYKALQAAPPFEPPGQARDAGAFLNPRVEWEGDRAAVVAYREAHPASPPSLELPATLRAVSLEAQLQRPQPDAEVLAADTGWMRELLGFDHWDWERDSPSELGAKRSRGAQPRLFPLLVWARIRLVQGAAKGDAPAAAHEVRQLSRLLYSTESLIGVGAAATLLGLERRLFEHVRATKGLEAVAGWTPASADTEKRLERVGWGTAAVLGLLAPAAEGTPVLGAAPTSFGRCAGLREAVWVAHMPRTLLERGGLRGRYAALGQALAESAPACRLRRARDEWAAPGTRGALRGTTDELCEGQGAGCEAWHVLPGARLHAGEDLLLALALAPKGY